MIRISIVGNALFIKIETYWNVNVETGKAVSSDSFIKIETYWNVNEDEKCNGVLTVIELK